MIHGNLSIFLVLFPRHGMMVFILFQKWEPISPQQRHGSSIVEVYRIVEEVWPFFNFLLTFGPFPSGFSGTYCELELHLCYNAWPTHPEDLLIGRHVVMNELIALLMLFGILCSLHSHRICKYFWDYFDENVLFYLLACLHLSSQ